MLGVYKEIVTLRLLQTFTVDQGMSMELMQMICLKFMS